MLCLLSNKEIETQRYNNLFDKCVLSLRTVTLLFAVPVHCSLVRPHPTTGKLELFLPPTLPLQRVVATSFTDEELKGQGQNNFTVTEGWWTQLLLPPTSMP